MGLRPAKSHEKWWGMLQPASRREGRPCLHAGGFSPGHAFSLLLPHADQRLVARKRADLNTERQVARYVRRLEVYLHQPDGTGRQAREADGSGYTPEQGCTAIRLRSRAVCRRSVLPFCDKAAEIASNPVLRSGAVGPNGG